MPFKVKGTASKNKTSNGTISVNLWDLITGRKTSKTIETVYIDQMRLPSRKILNDVISK
jgi:hypothetical protein